MKKLLNIFLTAFEAALKKQDKARYNRWLVFKSRWIMIHRITRKTNDIHFIDIEHEPGNIRVKTYDTGYFDEWECMQLNALIYDILRKKQLGTTGNDLIKQANQILQEAK